MKITFLSLSLLFVSFGLFAQVQVWRYSDTTMGIYEAQNMNIDAKANIYASGPAIFHNSNAGVPNASIVLKLDSSGVYHWSQGFVNGNYNNIYNGMAGDTLGNTYICGEFNDSTALTFEAYLTHIDSSGKLVWNDEYSKAGYYDANNNVEVDKTGNVWVAGTGNDVNYNQGMISSKFAAADSTPVWREYYYDISTGTFYNSYFPVGDNAGGMYNIGQCAFGDFANSIVLVKYNASGVFLWYRVYNSNEYSDEEPASGNADLQGNLYLADNSSPDLVNYNYVPYLKKVNVGGVVIWTNLFSDTMNNYYLSSSALDASYFYIAGSRNDSMYIGKVSASTGSSIWNFVFPGDTGTINKITLKNGAVYGTGLMDNDSGSTSFVTIKLDSNGNMIWNVTYDDSLKGGDRANDIVADNSGGVYVAGESIQAVGSRGSATVIKYYDAQVTCTLTIDSIVTTNATSNLTTDGAAFAVASGGSGSYNYNWSTGASTDTITGLAPNTYCVTVTDTTGGCIAILCDSVRPTNLLCNISIDSVRVTQVTPCYGGSNGTIFVYVRGNIGATAYSIDGGAHYQSDYRFFNLNIGVYNVEIKDAHNCTTGYINNPITISQPFADTPTITVRGDTFITGLYARYEWVVNGYGVDTDQTFINTGEGDTVNVYVEDTLGCIYASDTIITTCNLAVNSVKVTNVAPCYGGANGAITVHSTGGTGPISYSIDNGIDYQPDSIFGKLPPGNHVIIVKDTSGCSAIYSGNPVTITQPVADTPTLVSSNDTFSAGQYSKYSWYYADSVVDTNQFLVASATTYCGYISVQVIDVNGCAFNSDSILNICTGINSPGGTNIGVTIYPNPFNETLNVSLDGKYNGGTEVQLLDMLGQKLYDDRPAGNTFAISTTGLAQGAYLLRIRVGDQFLYRQVIKD